MVFAKAKTARDGHHILRHPLVDARIRGDDGMNQHECSPNYPRQLTTIPDLTQETIKSLTLLNLQIWEGFFMHVFFFWGGGEPPNSMTQPASPPRRAAVRAQFQSQWEHLGSYWCCGLQRWWN